MGEKEAISTLVEVHEGRNGAHQDGVKMRRMLIQQGFYWQKMIKDCINYAKGYEDC